MNIFFVANRHAVAAQSAAYSAPEGGMIINHVQKSLFHFSLYQKQTKMSQNPQKKIQKSKSIKKSTAIFEKSIQMKTHFTSTKAKVYFLGVSKSKPFSQNSQIL